MFGEIIKLYKSGMEIVEPNQTFPPIFYYMLFFLILFFPVTYLLVFIIPHNLYSSVLVISSRYIGFTSDLSRLPNITWYCFPSIICTIVFGLLLFPIWYNPIKSGDFSAVVAFMTATLVAVIFGTTIDVAFNPSISLLHKKYVFYLDFAFSILKQATLVAVIPLVETVMKYSYKIFRHNLIYSLRSLLIGLVGGLIGFIIIGQMADYCTGFIIGSTVGLIIRNTLSHGYNPILTPLMAYFAALGLPPFWHTFYELLSFSLFGVFGSLLTYSLVTKRIKLLSKSITFCMIGFFTLLTASFSEVTIDASFIKLIKNWVVFTPTISNLPISPTWFIGLLSTIAFTILFLWIVGWLLNLIIYYLKQIIVEVGS